MNKRNTSQIKFGKEPKIPQPPLRQLERPKINKEETIKYNTEVDKPTEILAVYFVNCFWNRIYKMAFEEFETGKIDTLDKAYINMLDKYVRYIRIFDRYNFRPLR